MTKNELTLVRIRENTLKIIKKYSKIHGQTPAQFFDKLATLLILGIDSLQTAKIEDLKQLYPYSGIIVCQDVRKDYVGDNRNE